MQIVEAVIGPLAGPECRRAVGRRRTLIFRSLAALPALCVLAIVTWMWWLFGRFMPEISPAVFLRGGLAAWEFIAVTIALVLAPAVTAGTLSGDKNSGALAMLLTSRVSAREIVSARLAGRMCLIGVMLLAGLPAMAWLSGLLALRWTTVLGLAVLPLAVALGGCGAALAASAVARRGRDALMAVYFLDLFLLVAPAYGGTFIPPQVGNWLLPLNPYQASGPAIDSGGLGGLLPLMSSVTFWTMLGLAGAACAAWRLVPVYLKQLDGDSKRPPKDALHRPAIGDRPMLWKELYIEQARRFSGVLRFVGWLVIIFLSAASLVLVAALVWTLWVDADAAWAGWATATLGAWLSASSTPICWIIQWGIGLRAAVAIASERERNTWDTLLTTPLEGHEIVWAKIWGNLYALRGLIIVAVAAWTLGLAVGAVSFAEYLTLLAKCFVVGAFMAAVGVWASASVSTATKAMTLTLVGWLVAVGAVAAAAGLVVAIAALAAQVAWFIAVGLGQADANAAFVAPFSVLSMFDPVRLALYALLAALIAWYCRWRFDVLAGRAAPPPRARRPPAKTAASAAGVGSGKLRTADKADRTRLFPITSSVGNGFCRLRKI